MGKAKQKRAKSRRVLPTGLPSEQDIQKEAELEDDQIPVIQSIVDKLLSPSAESKESAASTIARLVDKPEIVSSLLESNIIKIAGPLLIYSSAAVRHSIAGALRNLSACGGHEVSQFMVDEDVMTPLVALFKQYNNCWSPSKKDSSSVDLKADIFLQATHLLWNLCESSSVAVSIFNEQDLLPVLLRCLCISTYGIKITVAVAHCLHTVSENNPEVIAELTKPNVLERIQFLMKLDSQDSDQILLKTIAAGIITNVLFGKLCSTPPEAVALVMQLISNILNISVAKDLQELTKDVHNLKAEDKHTENEAGDKEDSVSVISNLVEKLNNILTAKQIAMEILTNICCPDECDDKEDTSSSDTSDDMAVDIDDIDGNEDIIKFAVSVPCEIQEAVVSYGLLEKTLEHVIMVPDEVCHVIQHCNWSKDISKRIHTVKCRALFCAQNIFQILDFDDVGAAVLYEMWINLTHLAFKQIDPKDTELLEAATGSVRAALQKFAEGNSSAHFQKMTSQDLQIFNEVYQQSTDAGIRVNVVRIVGTVGCLLGNPLTERSESLVKDVGLSLLEVCSKDPELWVIAEALDSIFDVFAEDHLDRVVQEINVVEKLNNLLPVFKGKIKQQRKHLGHHLPVISTAKTNLIRFIKYKNEQHKNGRH